MFLIKHTKKRRKSSLHLWVAWLTFNQHVPIFFVTLKGYYCQTYSSFFVVLSTACLVISDFCRKKIKYNFYGSMFNVISHISCNNAANFFMGEMIKNLSDYGEIYGIFGRWFEAFWLSVKCAIRKEFWIFYESSWKKRWIWRKRKLSDGNFQVKISRSSNQAINTKNLQNS